MQRFPIDLVGIIADYAAIWTIVPWVQELEKTIKISPEWPDDVTLDYVKLYYLCSNPMACDAVRNWDHKMIMSLVRNSADWAFDILEHNMEYYELEPCHFLSDTNPRAVALIKKHVDQLSPYDWSTLIANPAALELIIKYDGIKKAACPLNIYSNNNEDVWNLVKDNYPINTDDIDEIRVNLSFNSSTWAKRLMIDKNLEYVKSGMCSIRDPEFINKHVSKYISTLQYDEWQHLLGNPAAIHIIREHPHKIGEGIWSNPAIFEPTHQPGIVPILTELIW